MNLHMFKYTETCLTQSPTCTPNLTILAVVSTLKLKLHYSFYTGTTVFVILLKVKLIIRGNHVSSEIAYKE